MITLVSLHNLPLCSAKELDSGPSGARHRTGTMEFMAIELLKGTAHTYRHDLESFFLRLSVGDYPLGPERFAQDKQTSGLVHGNPTTR